MFLVVNWPTCVSPHRPLTRPRLLTAHRDLLILEKLRPAGSYLHRGWKAERHKERERETDLHFLSKIASTHLLDWLFSGLYPCISSDTTNFKTYSFFRTWRRYFRLLLLLDFLFFILFKNLRTFRNINVLQNLNLWSKFQINDIKSMFPPEMTLSWSMK